MKPFSLLTAALATLVTSGYCADGQAVTQGLEERFRRLDRDGDGKLTREELPRQRIFRRLDSNGDGVVTLEEALSRRAASSTEASSGAAPVARRDLAFGEHQAQRLDLYAPSNAEGAAVMLYVHGGGWQVGDKSRVGQKVAFFTGMGWVFVSVNYRLLPEGKHPTNVQDVARAVAWVHTHIAEHGGDPNRLFLMGHSAGAHLASLAATDGRYLEGAGKSLAILKGVIALDTNAYDLPALMRSSPARLYRQVFGEDPAIWRDASPICHVAADRGIPPFLICYSRGLRAAPNPARPAHANAFAKALRAAGVPAKVVDASDRSHAEINAWFGKADDRVTREARAFLHAIR